MPAPVRILSENIANKIAAGEVVERPASVIKELVENSLDADATDIRLEISGGGRRLIRISDNGHGMSREDALLALERHATSKLRTDSDLEAISSLGFRGEALPSIASVSRLRLKSRADGTPEGTEIYQEGGKIRTVTACGMATGTEITVEHLFFNTPARQKFLRRPETEAGHVGDQMVRLAIARPDVAFSYTNDGREQFRVIAATPKERIQQLTAKNLPLAPLSGKTAVVSISGFFAPPEHARSTTGSIFTYVNGRFVRDKIIQHGIMQAFRPVLERGRYPLIVLFMEIDPHEVDVNVHPTKHELRFRQQNQVHDAIHSIISEALGSSSWLPKPDFSSKNLYTTAQPAISTQVESSDDQPGAKKESGIQQAVVRFMDRQQSAAYSSCETSPLYQPVHQPELAASKGFFSSLSVIGQFHAAYILCQSSTALVIIDQHAAAERIRFQQLRKSFFAKRIESQRLLIPESLELSFAELETATKNLTELANLGFELTPFGGQTFMLTAVPAVVAATDKKRLVHDLLEELTAVGKNSAFDTVVDELLSRIACHSVVRGAHYLEKRQIEELLRQMDETDFAAYCPHGRPVYHELPLGEIERYFKRT